MKRICVIALCVIGTMTLKAQIAIKPSIGFNMTDFSKNPSTGKFQAKPGYQVGGSIAIGHKVYIEPGLYYVRKSTQYVTEESNGTNADYDISGIRIPVTLGANFIGNEKSIFSLRGFAGASAFIITNIKDLDLNDFHKANWGAFAGIGVDIAFLFIEGKYEWSLTNLQKEDLTQIDVGKSRTIFINAGVRIPL